MLARRCLTEEMGEGDIGLADQHRQTVHRIEARFARGFQERRIEGLVTIS